MLERERYVHSIHAKKYIRNSNKDREYGKCFHALVQGVVRDRAVGIADACDSLGVAADFADELADVEANVVEILKRLAAKLPLIVF